MDRKELGPGPVDTRLRVPGSKSLTNRALVAAALADGRSRLSGASESDDSRTLVAALRTLGFDAGLESVAGQGGRIPAVAADLQVGNAGTAMRFLTALVCLGRGRYRLDGDERMRERPIGDLTAALRALGAIVTHERRDGCPPLVVEARGLEGGEVEIDGSASSQFVSALLLAAPAMRRGLRIAVSGRVTSQPYIDMTTDVMRAFGAQIQVEGGAIEVAPGGYRAAGFAVEGDAAAAGYHFARAAVAGGRARVDGLGAACRQPEIALVDDLERMGCRVERGADFIEVRGAELHGIDVDMNDRPDSVQTLAVVALFAKGRTRIRNVANLRLKETDRLAALARELVKFGARVVEHRDGLEIEPPDVVRGAVVETYGDHRMAMSFAVAGAAAPQVSILDPGVVIKSYPRFWEDVATRGSADRRIGR